MPPLSVMIKPASSLCNLRCEYCFYHSLSEAREIASYGIMKESTAQKLIDSVLNFADGDSIYFAFQGGEPLTAGLDFFRGFVDYATAHNTKNSSISYNIQTNGTLINKEWAEFFATSNMLVGLSLDGDQNANKFRRTAEDKDTFSSVIDAVGLLEDAKVDFNILIVATGYTAKHIEEIYAYFKYMGFKYLQFIPCLRPFGATFEDEKYMTVKEYGDFLIRLFSLYLADYIKGDYVSIRYFDNLVQMLRGNKPEQCGMLGYCSHQFVIEGNGSVFPCDFYCTDQWKLGDINDDDLRVLAESDKAKAFIEESLTKKDTCKNCEYYPLCRGGGCKRNRADRDFCEAYRRFFKTCLATMIRVFSA